MKIYTLDFKMKLKYVLKLLLPVLTVVLLINILLITGVHKGNTTVIVQEIRNKHASDGLSSSDTVKEKEDIEKGNGKREAINSDDNVQHAPEKEKKLSENGESAKEKDTEVKTANIEPMKDDKIDAMIAKLRTMVVNSIFPSYFWNSSVADLAKRQGALARKTGKRFEAYKKLQKYVFASLDVQFYAQRAEVSLFYNCLIHFLTLFRFR